MRELNSFFVNIFLCFLVVKLESGKCDQAPGDGRLLESVVREASKPAQVSDNSRDMTSALSFDCAPTLTCKSCS